MNGNSNWSDTTTARVRRRGLRPRPSDLGPATNCFVGKATANDARQHARGAFGVIDAEASAVRIAIVELRKVAVEVLPLAMLIDTDHAALEDAEEAFDGVGGDALVLPVHVLAPAMVDGNVIGEIPTQSLVGLGFVGDQACLAGNRFTEKRADGCRAEIGDDLAVGSAGVAVDQAHYGVFVSRAAAAPFHAGLVADVGFIDLDAAATGAELLQIASGHGFADTVAKEPSGLHGALKHPLDLTGADALLGGAEEVDDLQPQVKRQVAGLEDGPHTHGERLFASVALAQAGAGGLAIEAADAFSFSAMRANRTVRPQARFDIGEGAGFGLHMGGVENGRGHGEISYGSDPTSWAGYVKCNIPGVAASSSTSVRGSFTRPPRGDGRCV